MAADNLAANNFYCLDLNKSQVTRTDNLADNFDLNKSQITRTDNLADH